MNSTTINDLIRLETTQKRLIIITKHDLQEGGRLTYFASNIDWKEPHQDIKNYITKLFQDLAHYEINTLKDNEPGIFLTCYPVIPFLSQHIGVISMKKFTVLTKCRSVLNIESLNHSLEMDNKFIELKSSFTRISKSKTYWNTKKILRNTDLPSLFDNLFNSNKNTGHSSLRNHIILKTSKEIKTISQFEKEEIIRHNVSYIVHRSKVNVSSWIHQKMRLWIKRVRVNVENKIIHNKTENCNLSKNGTESNKKKKEGYHNQLNKKRRLTPSKEYNVYLGEKIFWGEYFYKKVPWLYVERVGVRTIIRKNNLMFLKKIRGLRMFEDLKIELRCIKPAFKRLMSKTELFTVLTGDKENKRKILDCVGSRWLLSMI